MTEFWFGDIAVGFITEKGTSITKEVIEKNFVNKPVQVFELTPDLESGTYAVIFNEEVHPRNESLSEQRDAVVSMPDRHATELPFAVGGDKGHVVVEQASAVITPSQEIDTGEISIRFMEDDTYRPAFRLIPSPISSDFSVGSSSFVALSSSVENATMSPSHTISTEDGDLDWYVYSGENVLEYDRSSSSYSDDEKTAPVRVFSPDGSRVYSSNRSFSSGSRMSNGFIACEFGQSTTLEHYYSGSWEQIGSVNFNVSDGYLKTPSNYDTEVEFVESYSSSLKKGYPVIRYSLENVNSFSFNSDEEIVSNIYNENSYRVDETSSGREIIFIRKHNDGNVSASSTDITVDSITVENPEFYVGVVPEGIDGATVAEYVFNSGHQERTMVQR